MSDIPWWASEDLWRKAAIWITAIMAVILIFLTFHTSTQIVSGTARVPAYSVVNQRIDYRFDPQRNFEVPHIGAEAPLFGEVLSDEQARQLVRRGKLTFQAKNCMNCHAILGNGAYYAPDLTKAWLDPGWGTEAARVQLMKNFLMDPYANARTFGTGRRMPDLKITEEEAESLIAFLKWTSAIDTNGFPKGFPVIRQGDGS